MLGERVRIGFWIQPFREYVPNLHLEPLLHGSSTLEVLGGGLDVVCHLLLGQIDHVRREKGLVVLLEVSLIGVEHTIEPWQKLLGAVIGVPGLA